MTGRPEHGGWRHWLAYLGSGSLAFVVDAGVLKLLTAGLGAPVLAGRIASIAAAMCVAWLCHRTFTFAVQERPTWREFGRYLGVAWSASAVNYGLFAAILFVRPGTDMMVALVIAGVAAMIVSYLGLRFAAFSRPRE